MPAFLAPRLPGAPIARRPPHRPACCACARPAEVVVVGGGAAGFFLAGAAGRLAGPHANITILEAGPRVLQKVRVSGGGRCNVTSGLHHDDARAFAAHYPRGARALVGVLSRFGAADAAAFFAAAGVPLKREPSGKLFPVSDDSADVCAALETAAAAAGVRVRRRARVAAVRKRPAGGFALALAGGAAEVEADVVAVTAGSAPAAQGWARALGHTTVPQTPSLFSFRTAAPLLAGLAGVAVADAEVRIAPPRGGKRAAPGLTQRGALLVTHWGVSGPAVLALSAFGARVLREQGFRADCFVDWVPALPREAKLEVLREARRAQAGRGVLGNNPFRKTLPKRLWQAVVAECGRQTKVRVDGLTWGSASNRLLQCIADTLQCSVLPITGRGEFKDEFVTAGGVPLKEIDTKSFESKVVKGLYFAGEVLDVDGKTGGFNLEFAWSSGFIAGTAIAEAVLASRVGTV